MATDTAPSRTRAPADDIADAAPTTKATKATKKATGTTKAATGKKSAAKKATPAKQAVTTGKAAPTKRASPTRARVAQHAPPVRAARSAHVAHAPARRPSSPPVLRERPPRPAPPRVPPPQSAPPQSRPEELQQPQPTPAPELRRPEPVRFPEPENPPFDRWQFIQMEVASWYLRFWPAAVVIWTLVSVMVAIAVIAQFDPFSPDTWSRADSGLYLGIARDGYDLERCEPPVGFRNQFCGDAGWFPGYPWVMVAIEYVGFPLEETAMVVPWLFAIALLWLLWTTFLQRRLTWGSWACLAYAAFAPGQIYDFASFPLSMIAFFTLAHMWFMSRGRHVLAGLAGAAALLAYPLGILLVPVSALWLFCDDETRLRTRLRRVVTTSGLTACGYGLLVWAQQVQTGKWNAYQLVQEKYGHTYLNPLTAAGEGIIPLLEPDGPLFSLDRAPAAQTALVTLVLASCLITTMLRRQHRTRLDLLVVVWAVLTWVFPLTQANVSQYRSQAVLLPLALLVRHLPRPLLFIVVTSAMALVPPMALLFLERVLV